MSNLDTSPALDTLGGRRAVAAEPVREVTPGQEVLLDEGTVARRLLPHLGLPTVRWLLTARAVSGLVVRRPALGRDA